MRKKLQIYISSTYYDLIEERHTAVEAILQAGHIPAGIEQNFKESPMKIRKRWIDESDIYILIPKSAKQTGNKIKRLIQHQLHQWINGLPNYIKVYLGVSLCES
ncbi:DUF4062 domain-containing protein [Paenibacillus sp. P26]|nr:DUF4062 domain-containing protein [Paenibacillus sp. P26]UUZ91349.1 DUF4062 domain-containing protein [Paenibacillus sp. P25]